MEYSARSWDVVGPWVNSMADTVKDPESGGPWLPSLGAVKDSLNSVECAWRSLQPPA